MVFIRGQIRDGSRRHGPVRGLPFTLIELLVIIGVIGILAAMLLPALGRARAKGRSADCLHHLRQIQIAAQLYMEENDGAYARGHVYDRGHLEFWLEYIAPYLGELDMSGCPQAKLAHPRYRWRAHDGRVYGLTYNINFVDRWMAFAPPICVQDVEDPAGTISFCDGQFGCMHQIYLHTDQNPTYPHSGMVKIRFRHNRKMNTVHFDGHTETVTSTRYESWTLEAD